MEKILEYQKIDGKLFNLEKKLNESKYKKIMEEARISANSVKEKMIQIESKAGKTYQKYLDLNNTIEKNLNIVKILDEQKIDSIQSKELNDFGKKINSMSSNLNILQKDLNMLQGEIKDLLKEFNKLTQARKNAKNQYAQAKQSYDKEVEESAGEIDALKKELSALQSGLPKDLFDKYQKIRKDKVYPVFIPLKDKICGACGMEMPSVLVDSIKAGKFIECEHCRRVLYYKEK